MQSFDPPTLLATVSTAAKKDPSTFLQNQIGHALVTTDCLRAAHDGTAQGLSAELINLIVSFALEDMRNTSGSSPLTSLLRTSKRIRSRVARAFSPVKVWACGTANWPDDGHTLLVDPSLITFITASVDYHLLNFSVKRHEETEPPQRPACVEFAGVRNNFDVRELSWTVQVIVDELSHPDQTILAQSTTYHGSKSAISRPGGPSLTVVDACDSLERAFESLDASTWRFASPIQRALLRGSFGHPSIRAKICVALQLHPTADRDRASRAWEFETQAAA